MKLEYSKFLQAYLCLIRITAISLCSAFLSTYSGYTQEKRTNQVQIVSSVQVKEDISKREEEWKGFLNKRLEYNVSHHFTTLILLDILRESELTRKLDAEFGAKHLRSAVKKSVGQTFREEILLRASVDDYVEQRLVEPAAEFLDDYLVNPLVKIVTAPFGIFGKKPVRKPNLLSSTDIVQDALRGNEKNQLVNPINKEGIPGEEYQQPFRLPQNLALGARPLNNNPYGYATVRLGDWYTQLRLGAADILSRPRLNEVSLLFQTTMSPHDIVFSFGGVNSFKNVSGPDRYFGPHAFLGLSKIIANDKGRSLGAYLEVRAGESYNSFVGLSYKY